MLFPVYKTEDGKLDLNERFAYESAWAALAVDSWPASRLQAECKLHIQSIYEEGELQPEATVKEYLTVRARGNS